MIAEYEEARLDDDENAEEQTDSNSSEMELAKQTGLLATVKTRLAR